MVMLSGFFFLLSGYVLHRNRGHFSSSIVVYTFFFLLSALLGWWRKAAMHAWLPLLRTLLGMGLVLFLSQMVQDHRIMYAVPGPPLNLVQLGLRIALGLGIGLAVLLGPDQNFYPRVFRWLAVGLIVVLVTCQTLV